MPLNWSGKESLLKVGFVREFRENTKTAIEWFPIVIPLVFWYEAGPEKRGEKSGVFLSLVIGGQKK